MGVRRVEGYFRREWRLAVNRTLEKNEGRSSYCPLRLTTPLSGRVSEELRGG
jgi:hypothetical protein